MNIPWYVHWYVHLLKMAKQQIRKIVKNGRNSYYINLPIEIVRELKFRERQKLVIKKRGEKIIVEDWKR